MNITVLTFDTLESTNTEATKQARLGADEGLCIVARQQTKGRGRHGRTWVSEKDAGLYFSIVLRPKLETRFLPLITLMTGVAVHDTLQAFGLNPDIKWVNDILVSDRKIAGILAETAETKTGLAVIVGIGINIRSSNYPSEIADTATSIEAELGVTGAVATASLSSPPFKGGVAAASADGVVNDHDKFNNVPHLNTFRTDLRKNLTPAEAVFWKVVQRSKLDGRKFRRQHSVGRYILDFYCPSEELAIELDGQPHFSTRAREHDRDRRLFLEHYGIRVLRFENKRVFEDLDWVLAVIRGNFGWKKTTTPSAAAAATPPQTGGELLDPGSPPFKGGVDALRGLAGSLTTDEELQQILTKYLTNFYDILSAENGPGQILTEWRRRSTYYSGKSVRIVLENETITGTTDGLEENGALRVRKSDGSVTIVQAGDVERLRPTE